MLHTNVLTPCCFRFKFESIWMKFDSYLQTTAEGWSAPLPSGLDTLTRFNALFARMAKALQSSSDRRIDNVRRQQRLPKELILRLDAAMESRLLSDDEHGFRAELKLMALKLASLEYTIARLHSRVLWLKEDDVDKQYFHSEARHRQRSNHVITLAHDGVMAVEHGNKEEILFNFYSELMG